MVSLSPKEFVSANSDVVVSQRIVVHHNRICCAFACNRHTHGNSLENFPFFYVSI